MNIVGPTLSLSSPKGRLKNAAITPKRYEIWCQLLLITNRKSHTGFWLIPTSVTLNDLEWRNSPYFAFFSPNSIALLATYVTVVEGRPIDVCKILYPSSSLPLLAITNPPCSAISPRLLNYLLLSAGVYIPLFNTLCSGPLHENTRVTTTKSAILRK